MNKRSFIIYLLLSILTLGIYHVIFWYKFAKDLNRAGTGTEAEVTNYIGALILSRITCGIYGLVWDSSLGSKIQRIGNENGLPVSLSGAKVVLCRMSGYFVGILIFGIGNSMGMSMDSIENGALGNIAALTAIIGIFATDYILIKNMNVVAENFNLKWD